MYLSLNCNIKDGYQFGEEKNPKSPDPEKIVKAPLPPKVQRKIQTKTKREASLSPLLCNWVFELLVCL